jgi:hypothetical protein
MKEVNLEDFIILLKKKEIKNALINEIIKKINDNDFTIEVIYEEKIEDIAKTLKKHQDEFPKLKEVILELREKRLNNYYNSFEALQIIGDYEKNKKIFLEVHEKVIKSTEDYNTALKKANYQTIPFKTKTETLQNFFIQKPKILIAVKILIN